MNKKMIPIVQLFPDFEEKIDFLFQTDENFRDLCSDYMLCASMVLEDQILEYKELLRELEAEILKEILKNSNNS
ncbi:hypothetical protein [Xanthomarina sp. F2636L]|uniref:hypothetical protein n=1 Tax=Xanthomarina sp. F2636L TaxID=2996018 RepID=UPI00225DED0C|nr:hypothetical protein [Xanthomarina sp. F2636L]MCX7551262.1 hypothetical protein [Xanthomarina sp. F2636L]